MGQLTMALPLMLLTHSVHLLNFFFMCVRACACVFAVQTLHVYICLFGEERAESRPKVVISFHQCMAKCCTMYNTHTQYNNVDKKRPLPNTSPTQHKTDKTKFAFGCFSSLFPLHPYIFALLFSLGDVGNVWCFVCTHSPGVFQYKSYCCLRDKIMWLFTKAYSQHN